MYHMTTPINFVRQKHYRNHVFQMRTDVWLNKEERGSPKDVFKRKGSRIHKFPNIALKPQVKISQVKNSLIPNQGMNRTRPSVL